MTPDGELVRIREEQERERVWWSGRKTMESVDDLARSLEEGWAITVPSEGEGYRLSAKVREEFRVLERETFALLQDVAREWLGRINNEGTLREDVFLVISSLGRTVEFQRQLIEEGYPAAEDSTHTKLGAFDVATAWFKQNRPELLTVLIDVLNDYAEQGRLNCIDEPTVGAYHVALNPNYVPSDADQL